MSAVAQVATLPEFGKRNVEILVDSIGRPRRVVVGGVDIPCRTVNLNFDATGPTTVLLEVFVSKVSITEEAS